MKIDLSKYDLIIINSSGGKDSLCAIWEICRLAEAQDYDRTRIVISHQDLGAAEWQGTRELVQKQADLFGLPVHYSKRRDKNGKEETLLEYVERRKKWPSSKIRFCTSDFKRDPGARVLRRISKERAASSVLYVFGFRAEESPARSKRKPYERNKRLSCKSRTVDTFLPIHTWKESKVWDTIKGYGLPYHKAYDLGMPRLSCVFCIFSPFSALVLAAKHNPELLDKYIATERKIGHTFRKGLSLEAVKEAAEATSSLVQVDNWIM